MTENQTDNTSEKRSNKLLGVGLAVLLAAAAFFSGLQIGTHDRTSVEMQASLFSSLFNSSSEPADGTDLTQFWKVWDVLENKFVASTTTDPLTEEERMYGAIDGLVRSYNDPYTVFFPPQDAEQFGEDIAGNFGGVGMEVGIRSGVVTVISPLPESPAEKAGLLPADVVAKIDGTSTEGMGIDEAVQRIRGEKGTEVLLTIFRDDGEGLRDISVLRDTITVPTIDTEMREGVFIISLYSFNALAEQKMQEALREYVESDSTKLILDLRGNPGGFLQSAVSIASYFLPAGKVVVREHFGDSGQDEELYRSTGKSLQDHEPTGMVVLVNQGSASASEILAGALQEHGVATLIGETTFGKGSVQELVDLPDGSSLKVTIARWLTPDGKSISDGGLDPDIEVKRTVEDINNEVDPQLEAAIEFLNR